MPLSMYEASIPVFTRNLTTLGKLLEKGRADAEARKFEASVLLGARLAPDMFPLSRQVQIACDIAKLGAARLAGIEPPSHPDTETSFEELQARIEKTIAFLETAPKAEIEDSEARPVTLKTPQRDLSFTGSTFLTVFILPNLFFHMTTAYAIMRHNGVPLGKMDFLGAS